MTQTPMNQPTYQQQMTQPMNQQMNQPMNQQMTQPIYQQPTNQPMYQQMNQPNYQSMKPQSTYSVDPAMGQPIEVSQVVAIPEFIRMPTSHTVDKPVIYLYPEKEMTIKVHIDINKEKLKFLTLYPKFNEENNTWNVDAKPNGDIKIKDKIYPYLFWEAQSYPLVDTTEGFIVTDENAESFLEEKLKILGLNEIESTDFITHWLPVLLKNKILYVILFFILN